MKYRKFGKTGLMISEIGMGCEYIWHADEETACSVIQAAFNAGVNLYDIFVAAAATRSYYGKVLGPHRGEVYLVSHFGAVEIGGQYAKSRDLTLCKQFHDDFYEKLHTDYVDVLCIHSCDDLDDLRIIMEDGIYGYARELKDAGRAKWIGLSSHSTKVAIEAVKTGRIDVLMFPVNPLFNMLPQDIADFRMKGRKMEPMTDEEKEVYPTKQQLYDLCGEMGVPIIAMKPFAGGNVLKDHEEGRLKGLLELTPVQCISYALSIPQVGCPVPGVSSVAELEETLAYVDAAETERDFSEIYRSIVARFERQCMYCNHCQPCPKGIDIAEVTKLADMAEKGVTEDLKTRYSALHVRGGDCLRCGQCSDRCPFGIDAAANMRRAERLFGR